MPSTLARQNLINSVLQSAENDFITRSENMDVDEDSNTDDTHTSSASSSSSSSSSLDSQMSVNPTSDDDSDHDDESFMKSMFNTIELLESILKTRVISPNEVAKCSQLILVLVDFKNNDYKWFQRNLCVSPATFDKLVIRIEGHSIFQNNSNMKQFPVQVQLAVTLYRFGHNGNAASVSGVAQWASISEGAVVKYTQHVIVAFLALHDTTIRWPSEEDKDEAKEWVEHTSCIVRCEGYCMVDGTLIPLFEKPGHHGEAYFDRKSNYSLNVQVSCFR